MIDLHIHTNYSDGTLPLAEVLKIAEQEKLDAISITDHDNVGAYFELDKNPKVRALFSGKIITGIEITAVCCDVPVEILGYNFDYKKIESLLKDVNPTEKESFICTGLLKKIKELNLNIDLSDKEFNRDNCFDLIYQELVKEHKKFLNDTDRRLAQNMGKFFRHGLNNKKSIFYINYDKFLMPAKEAISAIHACGGKAFLAHPAEYGENADEVIKYLACYIDGIECYHPTVNNKYANYLVKFCKRNNLLVSGGSDFHGSKNIVNSEKVCSSLLKQFN